ncbi:3-dehydroquinate synthase [Cryptobacterium curtum]
MPNVKVVVNLTNAPSYDVRIGEGISSSLGERIRSLVPQASRAVIISDSNVAPLYVQPIRASLKEAALRPLDIVVPAGEPSKSIECLGEIWRALASKQVDRDCVVVALGGGVVGDLAGFAAATYLRGVSFVQVPTTLLAMVDSSVGGKTGIDLPEGKNLAGSFLQPRYVCADLDTLSTLDDREWTCGLGEVAKSAVIDSDDFFFWLVEHATDIAQRKSDIVQEAIMRCVVFKANVVADDEFERSGRRACLNYGHTLGHAIETLAGLGTYSHGACVAEGMRFAARLGAALAGASLDFVHEQDKLLDTLGLVPLDFSAAVDDIIDVMKNDKKSRAGKINFILPRDVGSWTLQTVEEDVLREHLDAWARSKG